MKCGATVSNDPWQGIAAPNASDSITAKRVDPSLKWDFFWGRSMDDKCLFALQHDADASPSGKLPRLRGIDVALTSPPGEAKRILLFKLQETAQRDIFERLCRDIVAASAGRETQKEAVATALTRTWRWHHLLRGGATGLLSSEEQKGLIAELFILERFILECFPADAALPMWLGPLDAPKDFECAKICIEAKARRAAATPFVYVSSAEQLDISGVDALFLSVIELDQVSAGFTNALTLTDVAHQVQAKLQEQQAALLAYEDLLEAAGFRWSDDYSEFLWLEGTTRFYRVADDFPRISASTLDAGLSRVTYSLSLPSCAPHEVGADVVIQALKGTRHG